MKNTLEVRIVESLSEQLATIKERIREQAYENFLMRDPESNRELDDWLAAERDLVFSLNASVTETADGVSAVIVFAKNGVKDLTIEATASEILVSVTTSRQVFALVQLPQEIDPARLEAKYAQGALQLSAPLSTTRSLQKTA
jgi:HSP20 family molecular chaperone IbpA